MVHIGHMTRAILRPSRRELITGLMASVMSVARPTATRAQKPKNLLLRSNAIDPVSPFSSGHLSPVWALSGPPPDHGVATFSRGDEMTVSLDNYLPVPAVLNWYGIDGVPQAEPLLAWKPSAAVYGIGEPLVAKLRHAGTHMFDLGLLADGQDRPTRPLPFVVHERETVEIDREWVVLIEERRLRPDGSGLAPGINSTGTTTTFPALLDISGRTNSRLRFRFVNGSHRSVIAIKIENFEVRVMALDGQPSEPFVARNGAIVLAPGGRADAFIDVTAPAGTTAAILLHDGKEARPIGKIVVSSESPIRPAPLSPAPPLPSNGLPERLDLKNATRVDLPLGGLPGDWVTPVSFTATAPPAFRAKAGRVVVLALTNRAAIATVFHLHGHHFRHLDRLDDGWKPFWLDTLAIEPGQTQRIAFRAEYPGRYLIESVATDWAAPRLVRWYAVE
jgi:hypothetical protein